ncbi:MAG: hypothetical protein ACH346_02235 [Chthoniobacterales bacterium]
MKSLQLFFVVVCLNFSALFTHAHAQTSTNAQADVSIQQVTAAEYCDFLNCVAKEDPDDLYNQAMASDPITASIVRVGAPGRWHYQVIEGRENYPIDYVSELAQASYTNRLQASSSSTSTSNFNSHIEDVSGNSCIEDVSSNNDSFEVEVPSTMLTLVSSSFPTSTSTSNFDSYITDVSAAVGLLGLLALGHEMVTLQDFRDAAATHPPEQRLILTGEGANATIQPKDVVGNRGENLNTADVLIATLQPEYPGVNVKEIVDEHLPKTDGFIKSRSSLTSEILRQILIAADVARERKIAAQGANEGSQRDDDLVSLDESIHSRASSLSQASDCTRASMQDWNRYEHLELEHFITHALEDPLAGRIVIDEGDSEMLMTKNTRLPTLPRSEAQQKNRTTTLAFKDALRKAYSRRDVSKLLPGHSDLYFESLGSADIFKYINTIEGRITQEIIKPAEKSDLDVLKEHLPKKETVAKQAQEFREKHEEAFKEKNSKNSSWIKKALQAVTVVGEEIGDAKLLGTSVGAPLKLISRVVNEGHEYSEESSIRSVKKIAEAAQRDLETIQDKIKKIEQRNKIKPKVIFEGLEPLESFVEPLKDELETTTDEDIISATLVIRTRPPEDKRKWNDAMLFEKEAEDSYKRATEYNTSDSWLACMEKYREAQRRWWKAAEEKQNATLKTSDRDEKNQLKRDLNSAFKRSYELHENINEAESKYEYEKTIELESQRKADSETKRVQLNAEEINAEVDAKRGISQKKDEIHHLHDEGIEENLPAEQNELGEAFENIAKTGHVRKEAAKQAFEEAAKQRGRLRRDQKIHEGHSWKEAEHAYQDRERALKAGSEGHAEESEKWEKAAELSKEAVMNFMEAANAKASGRMNRGHSLHDRGFLRKLQAAQIVTAIELSKKTADKWNELEMEWNELEEENKEAFDFSTKAVDAFTVAAQSLEQSIRSQRNAIGHSWNEAGKAKRRSAERNGMALQAKCEGKTEKFEKWKEAAELSNQAAKIFIEAANKKLSGNMDRGHSLHDEGLVRKLQSEQKLMALWYPNNTGRWSELKEANDEATCFLTNAVSAFNAANEREPKEQKDQKIHEGHSWKEAGMAKRGSVEQSGRALKAESEGRPEESKKWEEAADLSNQAAESFKNAAAAKASGSIDAGHSLHEGGFIRKLQSEQKVMAISFPKNADKWSELEKKNNEVFNEAFNFCENAATAYSAAANEGEQIRKQKTHEGNSWKEAGIAKRRSAEQSGKALRAECEGYGEESKKWEEAAALSNQAAENFKNAAQAKASGRMDEGHRLHKRGMEKKTQAQQLASKAVDLERLDYKDEETVQTPSQSMHVIAPYHSEEEGAERLQDEEK